MDAVPTHVRTLLSVEAGLKAELALVPAEAPAFSSPRHVLALRETLAALEREEDAVRRRVRQRRKELRDLKNINIALTEARGGAVADPQLEARVARMRGDLLGFAKQQWPPPAVADADFEGDLWEGVVRACMGEAPFADGTDPGLVYYADTEVHLAILLVQAGLAVHPIKDEKVLRLAPELFYMGGS